MLEHEHPDICQADDPHGEKRFKKDCMAFYNELMAERAQTSIVPQYERGNP